MPAVNHVHMLTQINTHMHTPTAPEPLILHFQPLGLPVEVEGLDQYLPVWFIGSRGVCLGEPQSHCHFDLNQRSSKGLYPTFVKY